MIRYALTCEQDHSFESWFQSAAAFDKLQAAAVVSCTVCGSTQVRKSVMAPRLGKAADTNTDRPLSAPASTAEKAFKDLRDKVEASSEHVGSNFASEARKIHNGEAPERPIYGEAKPQEAKALIDDGVPVLPLPFLPKGKAN
jgi:hypothetical protein